MTLKSVKWVIYRYQCDMCLVEKFTNTGTPSGWETRRPGSGVADIHICDQCRMRALVPTTKQHEGGLEHGSNH